jgi:hypothetical protein
VALFDEKSPIEMEAVKELIEKLAEPSHSIAALLVQYQYMLYRL